MATEPPDPSDAGRWADARRETWLRYAAASVGCLVVVGALAAGAPALLHWFLLPVLACGVLLGADLVAWAQGRRDWLHPITLVALFGMHHCFLAPLWHVSADRWLRWVDPPQDWRPWLGGVAALNFVGLVLYRAVRGDGSSRDEWATRRVWRAGPSFPVLLIVGLVASAALQIWIYVRSGGIAGYVAIATSGDPRAFQGQGALFVVSESFPALAMLGYASFARSRPRVRSGLALAGALAGLFALCLLFGGLRGSRSASMATLAWAVGVVHLWLRPLRARELAAIGLAGLLFVYAYGFYKAVGGAWHAVLGGRDGRAELERATGRDMPALFLHDLARADVQAYVLYRNVTDGDLPLARGRTYLGAAALTVPRWLWRDRPATKVQEGTMALAGSLTRPSSRVYGLAGEAMLNFGWVAVPLAFIGLGLAVRWCGTRMTALATDDVRRWLAPLGAMACVALLLGDSDNVVVLLVWKGAIPSLLVLITAHAATEPVHPLRQLPSASTRS